MMSINKQLARIGRGMIILIAYALIPNQVSAQEANTSELYLQLKSMDSLLFNVGFNQCDISQFENLTSEDFEFYHDRGGVTRLKDDFVESIKNGVCGGGKSTVQRELVENSLQVYPLTQNGVLYGAIQMGVHRFHDTTAKFTHVWLLEDGEWKISRALSYDHQSD
ncbi:nuclear transport factor 2 family protein [Fulvivirga ligni]|uniref:nuclear transport factor 2 family protein n=1 Tax=Fulvivirga ligni TaxID=2904246 RepID=UPI001F423504|nr:nuclear transport factor 2 family protein [Fulvivirga ligni]UII20720.1 nuclear transport factor 2 family protein [Fulvivirga ligni]